MADWFKFYENGIYESRFQWAIHEESGVCPVWVWILSECSKHKCDHFGWKGKDYELFGVSHVMNITPPRVNASINLLLKIGYIETDGSTLKVLCWNKFQSDYMRKLSKITPDSVQTLSGECPESVGLEEKRVEEKRVEEKRVEEKDERVMVFPSNLKTESFLACWDQWKAFRVKKKKCKDFHDLFSKQLEEMSEWGEFEAIKQMKLSMMNDWQGVFPPKNSGKPPPKEIRKSLSEMESK